MRTYGQYCPVARASEILAERWTPIIVRNLLLGCDTFSSIAAGAPGIPRSLLQQRLADLERAGVVERRAKERGRGWRYALTEVGDDLADVIMAIGRWGARWLDVSPEHLDPGVVLWDIAAIADPDRLPRDRVVVEFEFADQPASSRRFWLLFDHGSVEVCATHPPGDDEDLVVRTRAEAFAKWHLGWFSWQDALRSGSIVVEGAPRLARALPGWLPLNHFAGGARAGGGRLPERSTGV